MQPDLLYAPDEERQPESVSLQDPTPFPAISTPEVETLSPAPVRKKSLKLTIAIMGLGLLIFFLLAAFAWVGYWAYQLNTELTNTQEQLTTLQAAYTKLQVDYITLTDEHEKQNAELTQAKTDLEKANTDLSTAQADLDTSQEKNESLSAKIEKAGDTAEILYVMSISDQESDILKIDRLVTESNNLELIKQWDKFTNSPSEEAIAGFLNYLILTTRNSLR